MGAIASGGIRVLNPDVIRVLGISEQEIEGIAAAEQQELQRREATYRGDRPPLSVKERTVMLVDDGLATGSTMRAAAEAVRGQDPGKVVIAVPIASPDVCVELRSEADDVVCAVTAEPFHAVGLWYTDFSETTDDEIRTLLERAGAWPLRRVA
jgi:putative phosphoribosyl transferase